MPQDAPFASIINYGAIGAICVLLIVAVIALYRDLQAEKGARIADAKAFTDIAMRFQQQSMESVNKLQALFEELRKLLPPRRPL